MPYKILLESGAEKELERMPKKDQKRTVDIIKKLIQNPRTQSTRKISGSSNLYRARVGDWRIIYEIEDHNQKIIIFRIRRRNEAYQNL